MGKRGYHGVHMTERTRRKIPLPMDVVRIIKKDAHVEPKFVEKQSRTWKVKCILCGEPRIPRALDENGICRSASSCNAFRKLNGQNRSVSGG